MRSFNLLFLLLFAPQTFANIICSGQVIVENTWTPRPIVREVILELNGCERDLRRNSNVRVTIEIVGGDPMHYRGLVFTDGTREQKMVFSAGEVTMFRLTQMPGEQFLFELNMFDNRKERLGGIQPTILRCEPMAIGAR